MKKEWVNYLPVSFTYVNCTAVNGEIVFSRTSSSGSSSGESSSILWASNDTIEWADGSLVEWETI